jgi:hypothetical protein
VKLCAPTALVLALAPTLAKAQDQCSEILRWGIWENSSTNSSAAEDERRTNWACNASQNAGRTDGGFRYGSLDITGSDTRSSSSNACTWDGRSWRMSTVFSQTVRRASPEIARAWESCINGSAFGGRASIIYGADPRTFSIVLRVNGPAENRGTARISFLSSGGPSAVQCSVNRDTLSQGLVVTGREDIGCIRDKLETPVTVTVNYSGGLGATTLRLPAIMPPPPAPRVQRNTISIRAVDYSDGHKVAPASGPVAGYGDVLLNAPPYRDPVNSAQWRVDAPVAGRYRLEVELASVVPRPVDITVNGVLRRRMLNVATGGWNIEHQRFVEVDIFQLQQGSNLVEFSTQDVFPHLRTLRFIPVE